MNEHFHYMIIDGKSSRDFQVYISGAGTYSSPERSYDEVEVPGKNGKIFLDNGSFKNLDVTYNAWIAKIDDPEHTRKRFRDLRSFLASRKGYFRIEDTYNPDEFRLGTYVNSIEPEVLTYLQGVTFTLTFNCKPQRFIKKFYDESIEYTSTNKIFLNDTYFEAKPLIRAYGTGTININGVRVQINQANSYTDLDCELQEAYKDTLATNCNSKIVLTDGKFPSIVPGENSIKFNGVTKLVMYPRLYMI